MSVVWVWLVPLLVVLSLGATIALYQKRYPLAEGQKRELTVCCRLLLEVPLQIWEASWVVRWLMFFALSLLGTLTWGLAASWGERLGLAGLLSGLACVVTWWLTRESRPDRDRQVL